MLVASCCYLLSLAILVGAQLDYLSASQNAAILKDSRYLAGRSFGAAYTQDDGVEFKEESDEYGNRRGSYSYVDPTGQRRTVTYTAGVNGFQATGDHIPSAPPPTPVQPEYVPLPQYNPPDYVPPQPRPAIPARAGPPSQPPQYQLVRRPYQPQYETQEPSYEPQPRPPPPAPAPASLAYRTAAPPRRPPPPPPPSPIQPQLLQYQAAYPGYPAAPRYADPALSPQQYSPQYTPQYQPLMGPAPPAGPSPLISPYAPGPPQPSPSPAPVPAVRYRYNELATPSPRRFYPPGKLDFNRTPDGFAYTFSKS
ncbi:hypothetical protein QAD02_010479 [Eretmocerus hayati]|uniref:Uncharacterized protein n=1 Tax=Eretmocerus hayati TaxID=131215 RepID=A0ACC2NU26_9HYME|nr:hypothetical protein QAD02_010479 [Eretmocerus hayati]